MGFNRGICDAFAVALHTYISNRIHIVFAAKEHRELIPDNLLEELWAIIHGIAKRLGIQTYAIGGMRDHVHVFIGLPGTIGLSEAVQKIKANSSRFLHEKGVKGFAWQEGYGAFSVGISQSDATIRYIRTQAQHHAKRDFSAEFAAMLAAHGLKLNEDGRVDRADDPKHARENASAAGDGSGDG
jgi:REP element-mobilizing transposase RayT